MGSAAKTRFSSSHPPHRFSPSFFHPWTFHLYPSYPASSYVYVCVYICASFHAYLRLWVPLYVKTCLFDISFPLSVALKARVCLFSAKPRRERCVGAHRLARPGTTPHRNVWNYTQQGLAHPCLLSLASLFVILSLHGLRDRDGQTDRQR